MVDPPLDDEDPVGDAELARGLERRVEDDDLDGAGRVVELEEDHRLAALRRRVLHLGDDPADRDGLPVAAPLELPERRVGLAPQLIAHRGERVLGDVEPERLLLEPQQLALLVLGGRDREGSAVSEALSTESKAPSKSDDCPMSRSWASFCP